MRLQAMMKERSFGSAEKVHQRKSSIKLHEALITGHPEKVDQLIAENVDVNAKDPLTQQTPLMLASRKCHEGVAKSLLDAGAKECINERDLAGRSALMIAAGNNCYWMVKLFVKTYEANLDLTDNAGRTAIMQAASKLHVDIVKFLLQCGADISLRDNNRKTIDDIIEHPDHSEESLEKKCSIQGVLRYYREGSFIVEIIQEILDLGCDEEKRGFADPASIIGGYLFEPEPVDAVDEEM